MAEATITQRTSSEPVSNATSRREKELREAEVVVERVYRRYGNNLTAFYRDAHREAQRESEKRVH